MTNSANIVSEPLESAKVASFYWAKIRISIIGILDPIEHDCIDEKNIAWPVLYYSKVSMSRDTLIFTVNELQSVFKKFELIKPEKILITIPQFRLLLEYNLISSKDLEVGISIILSKSLSLIAELWPEARTELEEVCLGVAWFEGVDRLSYSSPKTFGILFINPTVKNFNVIGLATSLIHECAHHALFIETAIDKLIPEDYSKEVFSPLRGTTRPAIGALHGLMAMARMILWSARLKKGNAECRTEGERLYSDLKPKYISALRAMSEIRFSERGKIFMASLSAVIED